MPDLEKRVEELEAAVVWLAGAICTGRLNETMPDCLQSVFKEKRRSGEAERQEGLKIGFAEGSGLMQASLAEKRINTVED